MYNFLLKSLCNKGTLVGISLTRFNQDKSCLVARSTSLDFTKAFDTIDHNLLIAKLHNLDLPPLNFFFVLIFLKFLF